VSFWRYKLLELAVLVVTFPLFAVAFLLWGWLFAQFANPTVGGITFFLFAIPFLVAWLFVFNRIVKRAEKWWIARHRNVSESAGKIVRR
jgi:hypothetical protein